MRRAAATLLLALAAAALAVPAGASAAVPFEVEGFDVTYTQAPPEGAPLGSEGEAETRAGAHPFAMNTTVSFSSEPSGEGGQITSEAVRDIDLALPAGLVGDPTAVPRCATAEFLVNECPNATVVGWNKVQLASRTAAAPVFSPVYNLDPPPGKVAKLGMVVVLVPITIELGVKPTPPYNVSGGPTNLSQVIAVLEDHLTIWGNPGDSAHDSLRGSCLGEGDSEGNPTSSGECKAGGEEKPFLTLPRSCTGPLQTAWKIETWQGGGPFTGVSESEDSAGNPVGQGGCGDLDFGPEAHLAPSTEAAESASGLRIDIEASDEGLANPEGRAAADLAGLSFTLPRGVTVNPSAAEGQGVCSAAQFAAASLTVAGCPPAAKLAELEVQTPVLEGKTLRGSMFLAAQQDNPFGSLLAAYLVVRDAELGIFAKLAARIDTDAASGQIVNAVADIPPFPYSRITVKLRQGPRAPLVTPPTCGEYATAVSLTPTSGAAPLAGSSSFRVATGPGGAPCPAPTPSFAPGFEAGSVNPAAGRYSPFSLRLTRADGEQDITRFSAVLPPGVVGKVAGVPYCEDAAIAAAASRPGRAELASPSCPEASRIGSAVAGAGVGSALTYVPGSLYLAGPYNGAPLSVAAIVPAVAGPFDVGTVVTRVGLALNPDTGVVEVDGAASDPIPHILEGIPLKVRDLRVFVDRPDFTLNPTSCAEATSTATIFGSGADPFNPADDSAAPASARFQAASCASLGFKPKLRLKLTGATKRVKNPGLRAELLTRGQKDANLAGAIVNLPPSQFIDNRHISSPCTREQFAKEACPARSKLGWARAFTPLLDEPLEGPVYFRSNGNARKLPDLVAALSGTFDYDLVIAVLESKQERIRTKVLNAPDAPVSKFVLNMKPGKRSLLQNSEWLCAKKQRAYLNLGAQNGRREKVNAVVKTSCKKRATRSPQSATRGPLSARTDPRARF